MRAGYRTAEPDPGTATDQKGFRARLEDLQRWAGYASLGQLEAGAARRGTTMPVQTAAGALKRDSLPTEAFVERFVIACGGDVKKWLAARDALADRPYLRQATCSETASDGDGAGQENLVPGTCPYPGLAAFGLNEAQWFFGREKVIVDVLELLTERMRGSGPLMIAGPSGAGKSSLLRAGLLSTLNAGRLGGSRNWAQLVFTPTADPVGQLAKHVAAHLHIDPRMFTSELLSDPNHLAGVLQGVSTTENDRHAGGRVSAILIVDQFEDTFTLCSDEQRRQVFITALCAASCADGVPPALVVLGMRADFFDRCALYPPLAEALRRGQMLLGPMNDAELRDAVEKPAEAVGLELQPGLVDVMLGELGAEEKAAGALPLLAHALLATWQQRDGQVLTVDGYRLTGGITGAVAKTAERVYQRLAPDQQELAQTMLLRMIQFGDGCADTRRQANRDQLVDESTDPPGADAVLEKLIETRLVTARESTVEIVHEALLQAWPRLRQWSNSDRARLLQDQQLVAAAEAWDREGRHDSDLYRGIRLASIQERVDGPGPALPVLAREFLRSSAERERAEQQSLLRRTRRLRQLVVILSCVVLIAVTTTTLAFLSRNKFMALYDESVSREVAGVAAGLRVSDPGLAAQLAVAAERIADTAEARSALMAALVNLAPERHQDSGSGDAVQAVAFSPDGQLLVAAGRDTRLWAVGNSPTLAEPHITELKKAGQVRSAVFDPQGRVLVTSGADGQVRMWPVEHFGQSDEPIRSLPGPAGNYGPLAFSLEHPILATGDPSGSNVQLWDVSDITNPKREAAFVAHKGDVTSVALSRDGRTLATASRDHNAKLWDIATPASPKKLKEFDRHAGLRALAVAFSPNNLLAIGNSDGSITLVDVTNREVPRDLPQLAGHRSGVAGVSFSPDGAILATASTDSTAQLWNVSDPAHPQLWATLAGDAGSLYSIAFRNDHTLATSSQDRTVRLWETHIDSAVTEICESAPPPITPEQWQHYFPGYRYNPPCPETLAADRGSVDATPHPESTQLVAAHSDKCVTIKGRLTVQEAQAYQVSCTRTAGAHWSLQPMGPPTSQDVAYQIRNTFSRMCLDSKILERKVSAASVVVQRPCVVGSLSQSWRFERTERLVDSIKGRFRNLENSSDCLNVNRGAFEDGAPIIRWTCEGDPNEFFYVSAEALDR